MKIKIYDAIMGSGKTHEAIERMKKYLKEGKKFIYITPFLNEIDRVINELNSVEVSTPKSLGDKGFDGFEYCDNFYNEENKIDLNAESSIRIMSKRAQFLKMIEQGKNIISTHALFASLNKTDFNLFKDYILILDEVVNPIKVHYIGKRDIQILKEQDLILVDSDSREVKFINDDYQDPAFSNVKKLCNRSTVFYLDEFFLVWVFPVDIFKEFKEIQVLTYLFEGSLLCAYFKLFNLEYDIFYKNSKVELNKIKSLLNVYEGECNNGFRTNSFSKTWISNLSRINSNRISNRTSYIFKKVFNTKSSENAYTTFKCFKDKLSGNSYSIGYLPINSRATNSYRNKKSMAYLGNRYFDPQTFHFFKERGIQLNEDLWALCELTQWVWRGCIRDNKPMNLFIPNVRMRELLLNWLDGKIGNYSNGNILIENDLKCDYPKRLGNSSLKPLLSKGFKRFSLKENLKNEIHNI